MCCRGWVFEGVGVFLDKHADDCGMECGIIMMIVDAEADTERKEEIYRVV